MKISLGAGGDPIASIAPAGQRTANSRIAANSVEGGGSIGPGHIWAHWTQAQLGPLGSPGPIGIIPERRGIMGYVYWGEFGGGVGEGSPPLVLIPLVHWWWW